MDEDIKGIIVFQSIFDKDLIVSCFVEFYVRDKLNFILEMCLRVVLYFDEFQDCQDSMEVEVNVVILNEILGLSEDNGDLNNILG